MSDKQPTSRPALRKAADASVHPALAGRPVVTVAGATSPKAKPSARSTGKPLSKATKRAPTSDVLRPTKHDPAVTLKVTMPKSLRKKLRGQAGQAGLEPEQLALRLIAEGLR